ncbi:hypothetical protein P153DRAFT_371458 [Dothidotthia symphoricarpi CBS 119687]|uniref:Uncharacterized protein n=1 Tax=Dothidotthia symphoricarpi CBS 119687 TaxID=1392245 RepID=A0A6A5ZY35_9PLEO|nr:uncharacterized protein P153DRAFT_371458 [Dothidotthia symphoricarpi CBS 119687]KAF2123793.1 hypothetical protein P153DRAFT_371458 [Dothidotthia symphoricarpi CBS 119687]
MFAWLFRSRPTPLELAIQKDNLATQIANLEHQRSQAQTEINALLPAAAREANLTRAQAHKAMLLRKRIVHIDGCIIAVQDALHSIDSRETSAETVEALSAATRVLKEMQKGDDWMRGELEEFEETRDMAEEVSTLFGGSTKDEEEDIDVKRAFEEMDLDMERAEYWDKHSEQMGKSGGVRIAWKKVTGDNGYAAFEQRIEQDTETE